MFFRPNFFFHKKTKTFHVCIFGGKGGKIIPVRETQTEKGADTGLGIRAEAQKTEILEHPPAGGATV